MHLLAKFVAQDGLEDQVISVVSQTLEIRNPGSAVRGRALLCQREGDPRQILYVDTSTAAEQIQEHVEAMEPELLPLLAEPISLKRCTLLSSFRRWAMDATLIGCLVIRIPPERNAEVVARLEERGRAHRLTHPGMVAYQVLHEEQDPGFVVMLHEWRHESDLAQFRGRIGTAFADWITNDLGGQYHRYDFHPQSAIKPSPLSAQP